LEPANAIASLIKAPVETSVDLDEVDFGAWAGLSFEALAADPAWSHWNAERAIATTPAGDSMVAVQRRMRRAFALAARRGGAILVTHAEPIRAALASALNLSLDACARLEISPASVSSLDASGAHVCCVNQTFR
jgi:probable phosphoglycerate mutase